jgi:hypothetical protein
MQSWIGWEAVNIVVIAPVLLALGGVLWLRQKRLAGTGATPPARPVTS